MVLGQSLLDLVAMFSYSGMLGLWFKKEKVPVGLNISCRVHNHCFYPLKFKKQNL